MIVGEFIDSKKIAGAVCLIWENGTIKLKESYGLKNFHPKEEMKLNTIFRISSMTKPITSVVALMLYEEGKLNLEDPIIKWFPQFRQMKVCKPILNGKIEFQNAIKDITVLDLLTHRAGFTYSEFQTGKLKCDYFEKLGGDIDTELSNEQWINELAILPLVSQPGEIFNYGKSTDLLGVLIAKIEGKTLYEVMNERIFEPLNMTDTFFYVPELKKERCCANFGFDELGNLATLESVPLGMALKERPKNMEFESGGQGLWSTAQDYLEFVKIFVQKGKSNNVQILKEETLALMCTNALTTFQRENSTLMGSKMFKHNFGFGLGVAMIMNENENLSIPCAGSNGSVGWPGAYGGWWTADAKNNSIAILLTHNMTLPSQLFNGIGLGIYEAINKFATVFLLFNND